MKPHTVTLIMGPNKIRANRKEQLATLFERLARKEKVQRFLKRVGLDPRQFVLFLELFRTLSEREEFLGSTVVRRFNISYIAIFTAFLGVAPWSLMIAAIADNQTPRIPGSGGLPESMFLLFILSITFVFIFLIMMREAAIALFSPVETAILAHSPIHGPTYAAAKIAHILIAVLYLVAGLNLFPVLLEALTVFQNVIPTEQAMFSGARWFYPVMHILSALLIGLWTAFIICAFYGLIRRIVPVHRLKSIAISIQLLFLSALIILPIFSPQVFFQFFLGGLLNACFENSLWTWLPLAWFAEIGRLGCLGTSWQLGWQGFLSIIASIVFIWFGLRSFSITYLSEVISSMQRLSRKRREGRVLSRFYTTVVQAFTHSSLAIGVFDFVSKMIRRDWLFRRAVLSQTWIPLLIIVGIILTIFRYGMASVILGNGTSAYMLPHLFGLVIIAVCINLPFTVSHRASWIYLTAPIGSARPFAKGVFWALWINMAGLPHIALLVFFLNFLNWEEAVLIAGLNLIIVSLYLCFVIRFISGLPFSSPINESRDMLNRIYIQICGLAAVGIPLMLHQALCEHLWITLLAVIPLFVLTLFVMRMNLEKLEEEIQWRLYLMRMGSNQPFREIE